MVRQIKFAPLINLLFLGLLLLAASCTSNPREPNGKPPPQQTNNPPSSNRPSSTPPPVTVKIDFDMGQAAGPGLDVYRGDFKPQTIYVPVGTTVIWENDEDFLQSHHTVTSNDGLFDKELALGESFNYTFTKTGTLDYRCKIYPIMTGEDVVD